MVARNPPPETPMGDAAEASYASDFARLPAQQGHLHVVDTQDQESRFSMGPVNARTKSAVQMSLAKHGHGPTHAADRPPPKVSIHVQHLRRHTDLAGSEPSPQHHLSLVERSESVHFARASSVVPSPLTADGPHPSRRPHLLCPRTNPALFRAFSAAP
ncbi:hypothetical protein NDU88_001642 [Pleurodeles waltl]|uniref:Uncharacterized protein n=1 Tax=Pleurodeles waltl TaxID=8319 RepID=A0AAV7LZ53_PLEWA|nr:hypothetical protein NDU88_001642 [Pleurodeles waltl]